MKNLLDLNVLKMQKAIICFVAIGIVMCSLGGCKTESTSLEKLKDLDFTVVENADLPEELKSIIEEKKQQAFKLSYGTGEYLYIVKGYGEKTTGGYSIQIDELFETENAIYFKTSLLGPSKEDASKGSLSYPYIVVKTELIDKSVVFE